MAKKLKIGLALGGGGARGLAHIGVLKVLEANKIPLDLIAGTSIGAMAGAVYALHLRAGVLEERVQNFLQSPVFDQSGLKLFNKKRAEENFFGQVAKYVKERIVINLAHSRPSLVGGWRISRAVEFLIDDKNFEHCQIPFACVATDLISGKEIIFRKGNLRQAVAASISIPGFLPPVRGNEKQLVDGAVVAPIPIHACKRLGADVIIAVDVSQPLTNSATFENVVDVIFRSNSILSHHYKEMLLDYADIVIRPNVGEAHWSEFQNMQTLVDAGVRAAEEMLPKIRQLCERKHSLWQRIFG